MLAATGLSKRYRLHAGQGSLRDAVSASLQRLAKRRPDGADDVLWALRDVSFELRRGESLGVIGPNGAGKTTLLRVLSRVTRPTEGSLAVHGRLAALIELGAGFHPDLTGRENVYMYGAMLGLTRDHVRRHYEEIVAFSGLARFMETPLKRFSSGMTVRLGFAVAAFTDPEILLVDEVLAVGDASFRQKCVERIDTLRGRGVSIIFISHNLAQVRMVCDRGIFLEQGKVQHDGSVDSAIERYQAWLRESVAGPGGARSDTFDFVRGVGGSDLQITAVEIAPCQGPARQRFSYDEPIELRVSLVAHAPIASPSLVLRIVDARGAVSAMIRTHGLGIRFPDVEGEETLQLRLEGSRLVGGDYSVEARVRDAKDATTLAIGHSAPFGIDGPYGAVDESGGSFVPRVALVDDGSDTGPDGAP